MDESSRDTGHVVNDLYQNHLLYQNAQLNRQQLYLQWEQVNMMRAHQGLPPLPPPAPMMSPFAALWFLMKWAIYGFLIICVICMIGSVIT
jgi:hypothetical protein